MVEAIPSARVRHAPVLFSAALVASLAGAAAGAEANFAGQILKATGLKGGLIVHLGCGRGRLTAALHAGEAYLVQGLDADAEMLEEARKHIRKLSLYGPVSVARLDGKRLPYAENLANLVVAEDLGRVPMAEVMRVLAPGGAVYAKREGGWQKTIKPRPGNTDEWTHFLHDASGNAVAHDEAVGPPGRVQWVARPRHTRGHEHTPSLNAVVSTGGRIFYVADEGPIARVRQTPRWHLVARDAYNGLLLWKRTIDTWFPHIVNWGAVPRQLQRRLVAVGDRVYVTLGYHAPLTAVDAATGRPTKVYERTRGTEEVVCHKGILLLAVRSVTDERVAEMTEWARLARTDNSPLYTRDTAQPLVTRFRKIESKAPRTILAIEAATGRLLWKKTGRDAAGLRTLSLCALGDRAVYQAGGQVVCVDLRTGRQHWASRARPFRVACDRAVVCADGETVMALSMETGKTLWTQPATLCQIRDAFVIRGALWLGGFKPYEGRKKGRRGPAWGPYFATQRDLATGKVLKRIEPAGPGHHHRCWQNKATDRYILAGRRGVEFLDLSSGEVLWHSWVRGVCKYGVMPCNGLLYAPPHACGCYIAAKLEGFFALAPIEHKPARPASAPLLHKGPTYASIGNRKSAIGNSDWPTYRHDAERSGSAAQPVPAELAPVWQATVGRRITSPTVAGGKVFVAAVDEHTVCALEAVSGRLAWRFAAGGRVDSPPSLAAGRAVFGCRDGCVYSLRADDGKLDWRLRAARDERLVTACGQLESVSPVPGSVLIDAGRSVAYLTAGRSSYLDGGIDLLAVQVETGKVLSRTRIYSPDPKTHRQPEQFGPAHMPGALTDILSSDAQRVYLRDMVFDKQGVRQPEGKAHLFTLTGFLDGTWPHRSYWIFGTRCSLSTGCSGRDRNLIYGRLLVFDGAGLYGYGRTKIHWSNQMEDGAYRLYALDRAERKQRWSKRVAIRVRAMVLAGKVLFAAGPPAETGAEPPGAADKQPATLLALSADDGSELARCALDATPVFDGMAAAGRRLYIALENGRLVCLGAKAGG